MLCRPDLRKAHGSGAVRSVTLSEMALLVGPLDRKAVIRVRAGGAEGRQR